MSKRKAVMLTLTEVEMGAIRGALRVRIEDLGLTRMSSVAEERVLAKLEAAWEHGATTHAAALAKLERAANP